MKTSEKIRQLRIAKGLSQEALGELVGVKKAAINKYETGRVINIKKSMLVRLADALGVLPADLLDDIPKEDQPDLPSNILTPAAYPLPILGTICAGDGILCEENFDGFFFVDNSIRASYCLHVHGDSMIDAEIYDEDIVFIRKDYDFKDGKIYAVVFGAQQDAVLRKIYRDGGKVILMPCNNSYKPLVMDPDDIFIIGECVGMYRPIK